VIASAMSISKEPKRNAEGAPGDEGWSWVATPVMVAFAFMILFGFVFRKDCAA
jgi:hypothetical protein